MNFFTYVYNEGVSCSVEIPAKSAIAHVLNVERKYISQHPSVSNYAKDIYNLRLPLPKVPFVWDVEILFDHIKNLGGNKILSGKTLSQNLVLL